MIGWVYIAGPSIPDRGPCKVGKSLNPSARMKVLRLLGDELLRPVLYRAWQVFDWSAGESAAHRVLRDRRIEGEWFDLAPEVAEPIVLAELERCGHLWTCKAAWALAAELWPQPEITVAEIKRRTGIGASTLYRAQRDGLLPQREAQPLSARLALANAARARKKVKP